MKNSQKYIYNLIYYNNIKFHVKKIYNVILLFNRNISSPCHNREILYNKEKKKWLPSGLLPFEIKIYHIKIVCCIIIIIIICVFRNNETIIINCV